jgi:ribonucrease Y
VALVLAVGVAALALLAAAVIVVVVVRAAGGWSRATGGGPTGDRGASAVADLSAGPTSAPDSASLAAPEPRAAEQATQVRQKLDEEIGAVTAEARQRRADLERREVRVAEREERLDGELHRFDQLSKELDQARGAALGEIIRSGSKYNLAYILGVSRHI